jgi:peptidoglycan hydrolase CwlO-like protein
MMMVMMVMMAMMRESSFKERNELKTLITELVDTSTQHMRDTIASLEIKTNDLNDTLLSHATTITALQQTIDSQNTTIDNLNATINAQNATITAQNATILDLQSTLDTRLTLL